MGCIRVSSDMMLRECMCDEMCGVECDACTLCDLYVCDVWTSAEECKPVVITQCADVTETDGAEVWPASSMERRQEWSGSLRPCTIVEMQMLQRGSSSSQQ